MTICIHRLFAVVTLAFPLTVFARLPPEVSRILQRNGVPEQAVSLWVQPVGSVQPRWTHRADEARNPASVMKLLTSFAALDMLGPAYTWKTEAFVTGPVLDGVLKGDLVLRGSGDPFLTWDRFGGLLRELRERGLREIDGRLILDRSRLQLQPEAATDFDGRGARAYNAQPDALLVNFNAITLRLVAEADGSISARATLPLARLSIDNRLLPLPGTTCNDWKTLVAPEITGTAAGLRVTLPGKFPSACGEKLLNLAVPETAAQVGSVFTALWSELGGSLHGEVADGLAPTATLPLASLSSPPLADVLRDTDKYSNNVMARQIFITLGRGDNDEPVTVAQAIARIRQWMPGQNLAPDSWVLENGSGLSRRERTTASQLGALLLSAWKSPRMPEFLAAQPVIGVDGTMKKRLSGTAIAGRGYVKTGTLDGVKSAAGYVLDAQGRWIAFAWLINHPQANEAGDAALDSLLTTLYEGD